MLGTESGRSEERRGRVSRERRAGGGREGAMEGGRFQTWKRIYFKKK